MKQMRWMIPAVVAMATVACNEAARDLTSPGVEQQHAVVSCTDDRFGCGSSFEMTEVVSDTSPPAPARGTLIDLASTNYIGFLVEVRGVAVEDMGKTVFWGGIVSDTSPPAPAPNAPAVSLAGKMGRTAFLSLLNKAMSAGGSVGPAPSDTSPPGPSPAAAVWRDASGQPTQVLMIASVADLAKFGMIKAGDNTINMRVEMLGSAKRLNATQYASFSGVSIIGPERTGVVKTGK